MTDATADETAPEPQGRLARLLGRKKLVIVLAALLFLAAVAGGLWAALGTGGVTAMALGKPKHAEQASAGGSGKQALLPFKEIVVNISGSSATGTPVTRFLRIRLDMVYAGSEQNKALMAKKQPYLRDAIVSYLRQLGEDDLRGSDGLLLLKAELLKRARAVVGNDAPQEFLVGELVMQ
jgi:flagellar protein FliL